MWCCDIYAAYLYLIVIIFLVSVSYSANFFSHEIQSGGLSRQAAASNILLQDFLSIREAVDELKSCSEANTIESKQWTAHIEGEIASLNHKVQKHETEGIEARAEVGNRWPCC